VGASLATGAPTALPAVTPILPFQGKIPKATVKIHKDKRAKRTGKISRRDNLCVAVALNASETTGYRVMMSFGQLSGTDTVRNVLQQKSCLSFLTFCPSVSLTTGNIHKKAGKKASQKAQLYLRDAPPPADFDILT